MKHTIDLFNRFIEIQDTPLEGRIVENFDLYKDLFETITINDNQELYALKINLFFFADINHQFYLKNN